jgi:hypothetical protein
LNVKSKRPHTVEIANFLGIPWRLWRGKVGSSYIHLVTAPARLAFICSNKPLLQCGEKMQTSWWLTRLLTERGKLRIIILIKYSRKESKQTPVFLA